MGKSDVWGLTIFLVLSVLILDFAWAQPGSLGPTHLANAETQGLVTRFSGLIHTDVCIKQGIPSKRCEIAGPPKAISYKSQVVQGTNYFIKILVGKLYWHCRIYVPLPQTMDPPQYAGLQGPKTASDPIVYFDEPAHS